MDDIEQYEVNRPLTLMNHTKCDCKCSKTEEQCRRESKVNFFSHQKTSLKFFN